MLEHLLGLRLVLFAIRSKTHKSMLQHLLFLFQRCVSCSQSLRALILLQAQQLLVHLKKLDLLLVLGYLPACCQQAGS